MNDINKVLKEREAEEAARSAEHNSEGHIALDDTERIKVLSPGQLVFKRFIRNKLAIVGTCILLFMFLFAFAGPLFYGYSQTQIFYKYDSLVVDYASATERTDFAAYRLSGGNSVSLTDANMAKAYIEEMIESSLEEYAMRNTDYVLKKAAENIYTLSRAGDPERVLIIFSTYVIDTYDTAATVSETFKIDALEAACGTMAFSAGGTDYTIADDGSGNMVIYEAGSSEPFALFSTFVVRRYNGEDTLSFDFKRTVAGVVENMVENNVSSDEFTYLLPELDDSGNFVYNEDGSLTYKDTEIYVTLKKGQYVLTCEQVTYLIDIYGSPSKAHLFGTDGDGMDVLARMMYGGRISLIVGFVVVLIETILGVIMGGIAGYFGGWIDTLVMRLVDVFYCIPTMPILIILGSMFDALRMDAYVRLMWLMAILGFLGWASVARLVRGQILSLREQDFMVATEATGLKVKTRIFRHLVPNVMPQLIVTATAGLGSVILTESTLSFLGLGVKHPLATWGTMINSVSDYASMINYVYIWLPVGILICLTVIAFNFVGDGLRDAFDPKMKR